MKCGMCTLDGPSVLIAGGLVLGASRPRLQLELESFYSITTFIRAITSLLQIRQVAQLRSTTCNLQGLSPTQRSTQTTPSRNLTLGVMQLVTLRSPETMGRDHPCLLALRSQKIEGLDSPQSRRTTGLTPS